MSVQLERRQVASLFQLNGLDNGNAAGFISEFRIEKLPQSGRSVLGQDIALMWNGPGMWVLESESKDPKEIAARLRSAFESTSATATDLSSARMIVRVTGPMAARFLKKGSPVDIDALEDLSSVSTLIGHHSALIHRHGSVYDLYVMQTFGADFWHWCKHNAREFKAGAIQ